MTEQRNVTPAPSFAQDAAPLHTPLVWAWGGVLLTATLWLTGMVAVLQSFVSLFR